MHRTVTAMALATTLSVGCSSELGSEAPPPPGADPSQAPGAGDEQPSGGEPAPNSMTPPGAPQPEASPGAAGPDPTTPTVTSSCQPGTPQSTQLPRLTNLQYDNTIRDLIGIELNLAATTLAADSKGNMDARTWSGYSSAAASVASAIFTDPTARAKVITCSSGDFACAQQVISDFGAQVFRRPLTQDEQTRFEGLFSDTSLTETGSFDEQLQVVFEAMFQSPFFVTIAEISETPVADATGATRFALDDFELASRLSYMLWDSKPDTELFNAAAAGQLTQGNGLMEQASRMLADDRASGLIRRLHMDYLRMGPNTRWTGYERDQSKYPHYSPNQIDAVAEETLLVAQGVASGGGSFSDLMTTTVGYVNADTAPLYGLEASDYGPELVAVDLGPSRPGLLTRAGWLAANSYGNRTSPIHRGAFIEKDVLCANIGNPSPNAASTPLPQSADLVTNRQRTEAQTALAADCVACHEALVNPPGFALEGFDATGAVQLQDNGVDVDTVADVIIGAKRVRVTGAAELMAQIASAPEAQRCYAENWAQVAYNRVLQPSDACTVEQIAAKMADGAYSVVNLVTDLALVESFRYRAHETTEVAQ